MGYYFDVNYCTFFLLANQRTLYDVGNGRDHGMGNSDGSYDFISYHFLLGVMILVKGILIKKSNL
ncbi:hypothetical protein SAMN05428946_2039 [Edaphobacillus lindanitolerans]|uniref:Uncharacterized protein n=1 Tax=Edaphobacillus lindanitolerans TaxID=550447 RepID=A0A1U7PN98_9BACI|nr:hypothetical protein SAMN05428946_2039 [Edaphobacillus lindanitolerans]